MTHYIAEKTIKDAVSRLATQTRTQNHQDRMLAFALAILFESPEGTNYRKRLEAKLKARMDLGTLYADDEGTEFAKKVEVFEEKADELALELSIEDAKKMVDENLRMLARS